MVYICHNALSDSVMQPIRVETAAGQVHTAVMHTVDMDTSIEDIRMTAMYVRSPIHTLMFSSKGALLGANSSALEACRVHTAGGKVMTVFQTHPDSPRLTQNCKQTHVVWLFWNSGHFRQTVRSTTHAHGFKMYGSTCTTYFLYILCIPAMMQPTSVPPCTNGQIFCCRCCCGECHSEDTV